MRCKLNSLLVLVFILVRTSRADSLASNGTLDCDREMRKTLEALQAWRRTHSGQYPARLSDLKAAGLMRREAGICPEVLREATSADAAHEMATSRVQGGDPPGTYEYELSARVPKSEFDQTWLPPGSFAYTRRDLKVELLKRKFYEQVPILRCNTHRRAAPKESTENSSPFRNCTVDGLVYWSGKLWEQRWLSDVPYCCREANVLFGLKGPPFDSGRSPALTNALDLRPWVCAFGDHPWWWTFPMFDEKPNRQETPQLKAFFREQPGRVVEVAGTRWWIDGLVQLQGRILTDQKNQYKEPGLLAFVWDRTGLQVNKRFNKAIWLQGTVWPASAGETVGWLVWHYTNGVVERVPIVYGQTTARFWGDLAQINSENGFPDPVWKHQESADAVGKERWLRLYKQSWDNPRPNVSVTSLDFVSNRNSPAAPFVVAINVVP